MKRKTDIAFGFHSIMETIQSGKEIEKVLIKKGLQGELYRKFFDLVQQRRIPFQFVPIEKLNKVTGKNHQGVIAYISPVNYCDEGMVIPTIFEEGKVPFILILDGITDVRNFGAIVRTADCAGVDLIVVPSKNTAQMNADAIKTSAGALNHAKIARAESLPDTIKFIKNCGIEIIAATEKADKSYTQHDLTAPLALIMGSEDVGIHDKNLKLCDHQLSIPILGKVDSLNVGNAAAVLMYEVVRQRS